MTRKIKNIIYIKYFYYILKYASILAKEINNLSKIKYLLECFIYDIILLTLQNIPILDNFQLLPLFI
jgi:hypothetical protein